MKKYLFAILVLLMSSSVFAGIFQQGEVNINRTSTSATVNGVPSHARNSADSMQYIFCSVNQISPQAYIICGGRDKTGMTVYGVSYNTEFVDTALSIKDDSLIHFTVNMETGIMKSLSVMHISGYILKQN